MTAASHHEKSLASGPRPVALITGASRRIGRAIATELARHGFDLILTYRTSREEMLETVRLASQAASADHQPAIQTYELDLDSQASTQKLISSLASLRRLDALIHNASLYESSTLDSIDADTLEQQYRIHVVNPLMFTRALLTPLRASILPHGASIIAFTDMHVLSRPRPGVLAYSLAKAALTEAVLCLARELAPAIRVNAIAPGLIDVPPDLNGDQTRAYINRTPLGRQGEPTEAAALVRWLILEASFITGEVIRLDGGRHLR